MKILFIFLIGIALTVAAVQSDLVTDLNKETGYDKPWYSGYFDVSSKTATMKSHYFFFPSQGNSDTDPVLLWLNGGPGCSSLLGASLENGPWVFEINSTKIKLNPFSWNNNANVLYIESPPGVGYSTTTDYQWDDASTAQINLQALIEFFNNYEEYRDREFYISGESYAGIYLPTLATDILQHNKQVSASQQINFKGMMVGNGCTDPLECNLSTLVDPFMWETFSSQGFFTPEQQLKFAEKCGSTTEPDANKLNSLGCFATAQSQLSTVTPGVNIYNLIGTCYYQNFPSQGQNTWMQKIQNKYKNLLRTSPEFAKLAGFDFEQIQRRNLNSSNDDDNEIPPCADVVGPLTFFNTESVKKALHVDTNIQWNMCSDTVGRQYHRSNTGTYSLYPNLIENNLRIWIYSGDTDAVVSTSGTFYWFNKLVNEQQYSTTVPWRAWYTEGVQYGEQPGNRQNAGQFWGTDALTLVTFKGCGHQVPQDNYVGGYDLVTAFMNGQDLPAY